MATFRLALRMLARDWRAGDSRCCPGAGAGRPSSVGTVAFFADPVVQGARAAGEPAARRRPTDLRRPAAAGNVAAEAPPAGPRGDAGDQVQQHGATGGAGRRGRPATAPAPAVEVEVEAAKAAPCSPTSRRSRRRLSVAQRHRVATRPAPTGCRRRHSAARPRPGPTLRLAQRLGWRW